MKALLVFLFCAAPAAALLLYLDRDREIVEELPENAPLGGGPALLSGSDLADDYGQSPFPGSLRQLDGFELRVVEEGYFKLYLRIERLARRDGKPRLEEVRAAIFDPPKEGKPNLRLTLRAPFVAGDPKTLLNAPKDAPRIVDLDGGVEVFDAAGRPLAEVPRLTLDVHARTATSDASVVFRMPERGAEIRATGLDADLQLRTVRLHGPVVASLPGPGGTVTARAKGGATIEDDKDHEEVHVVLEGDAQIEQALGRATCPRIEASFSRSGGTATFLRAALLDGVHIDLAPETAHGLRTIDMPSVSIAGEDDVSCEGPVHATWRGKLPESLLRRKISAMALGERTVTIDATSARFRLARAEDGSRSLQSARFQGLAAADSDGAGTLAAEAIDYDAAKGTLLLEGAVDASTPAGSLAAERVLVEQPGKDACDARIEGEKRICYRADEGLGLLGGAAKELRLTATGPLRIEAQGDRISFRGEGDTLAVTDTDARLRADALAVTLEKGALVSFSADGAVAASDPAKGVDLLGDRLRHEAGATTIEGRPASVATKDGRSLRAPTISYADDGSFRAEGGVRVLAPLAGGGTWDLSCDKVRGSFTKEGTPSRVDAEGHVRALGPNGEEATGDALAYDGEKGIATLLGDPARLRRGDEVSLVAPKGLTLLLADGKVAEGSSLGPSTIDYRPRIPEGEKAKGFQRWLAELKGPARFEGDRMTIAEGAKLTGFDGDTVAVVAEAKRVEILLDVAEGGKASVREISGSGGVRVEGHGKEPALVTADRLTYAAGTKEVHVAGGAQVTAQGWPREVRFKEVVFALGEEGIDLKRAAEIEVR
jgi:lipopolysaccharide export system protein LptA